MEHEVREYFAEANRVPPEVREIDLLRNRCHIIVTAAPPERRLAVVRELMRTRECRLLLQHAAGATYRALAEDLGCGQGTVARAIRRGRELVEEHL